MEVKVYYDMAEGSVKIESHSMPDFAGTIVNRHDKASDSDVTTAEADEVGDLIETLTIDEHDGIRLSRRIAHEIADEGKPAPDQWHDTTRTVCVVPGHRMRDVRRVACDNEVVWPEEEAEDSSSEAEVASSLDRASSRLEDLLRKGE